MADLFEDWLGFKWMLRNLNQQPMPAIDLGLTDDGESLKRPGHPKETFKVYRHRKPGTLVRQTKISAIKNIRRTAESHEPVEHIIEVLVEAVDRELVHEDIQNQIAEAEGEMRKLQSDLDESSCVLAVLKPKLQEIPDLMGPIRTRTEECESLSHQLREKSESCKLLNQRSKQADCSLRTLFQIIYGSMTRLIDAIDQDHHVRGLHVDNAFAIELKLAAECQKLVEDGEAASTEAQRAYFEAQRLWNSTKYQPALGKDTSSDKRTAVLRAAEFCESVKDTLWARWQDAERTLALRRKSQKERESFLLKLHALPSLLASGKLRRPASLRPSEPSSTHSLDPYPDEEKDEKQRGKVAWRSGVAEQFVERHDGQVAQRPIVTMARDKRVWVTDGRDECNEILRWRKSRRDTRKARNRLDIHKKLYSERLADHIYLHPSASQDALDAIVEQELGRNPSAHQGILQDRLRQNEAAYDEAQQYAGDAGLEDLPLSQDWAASDTLDGKASSCASNHFGGLYTSATERYVRRWCRSVVRNEPPMDPDEQLGTAPRPSLSLRSNPSRASSGRSVSPFRKSRRQRHKTKMQQLREEVEEKRRGPSV